MFNGEGEFYVERAAGKLSALVAAMGDRTPAGAVGFGHTRWATHGRPTDLNAHPHLDCHREVAVIHNGIIENHRPLKRRLIDSGHSLVSDTDTEVIAHLVEEQSRNGEPLEKAVTCALESLEGAFSILVMGVHDPGKIVAARVGNAGGIVVGYGDEGMYLASDLPAILPYTNRAVFLEDGDLASVEREDVRYFGSDGQVANRMPMPVSHGDIEVAKGGYKHFMLKEIMEQPQAVTNALRGRISFDPPAIALERMTFSDAQLSNINRVVLVGMGTSLHAAMVGRVMMEELAGITAEVDNASEFRYRDPIIDGVHAGGFHQPVRRNGRHPGRHGRSPS